MKTRKKKYKFTTQNVKDLALRRGYRIISLWYYKPKEVKRGKWGCKYCAIGSKDQRFIYEINLDSIYEHFRCATYTDFALRMLKIQQIL